MGADAECRVVILTGAGSRVLLRARPQGLRHAARARRAPSRARGHRRPGVHGQPHRAHAVDAADHRRRGERRRLRRRARHRRGRRPAHRRRVGHVLLGVHPHRAHRHRHRRQLHAAAAARRGARVRPHRHRTRHRRASKPSTSGWCTRVVPDDALHDEAIALASQIAAYTGDRLAHDQGGHVGQPRRAQHERGDRAREPQPDDRRTQPRGAGLHGRVHGAAEMAEQGTMARHPFHDVAIVGVHNTEQARVLEGHDSRSITFDAGSARSPTPGCRPRDIDGVIGPVRQRLRLPGPDRPGVALDVGLGIPAVLEAAGAIADGLGDDRAHQRRVGGRLHRPRRRPRRGRVRRTSSSRRSACSPRPSSRSWPVATCTCTARRPRRWRPSPPTIRNNGHVQPRGRLLRARAVHACRTSSTAAWSPTRSTSSTAR